MHRAWRVWVNGLGVFAAAALFSCAPKGTPVDQGNRNPMPPPRDAGAGVPDWFPHAVDLRIHPATRYVKENNELRLEARIELLDQFNEPIKDVGVLMVDLRTLDEDGRLEQDAADRRDHRWTFDITTQQSQMDYWDPIARAYVLPLKIHENDQDLPTKRTVLLVTFQPAWPGADMVPRNEDRRKPVEIRRDW